MNQISFKKPSVVFLCLLLLAPAGHPAELFDRLKQPYVEHPIPPVDLTNSPRIRQLLRSGNIYLSLSDAVALAICGCRGAASQRRRPAERADL